jgi:site-specific DNA recombinase
MVAITRPKRRCAIYTRKSHEEGLDRDFNSLDAQRDSAETFIASQKHEGWVALATRYDDGGFTGANTERPALKRLLADVEAGLIDVVVVYKIDRLSRSLLDFVNLLQVFERKNVAFVSVTQQFNTANPMGRLILNILICFAQFERENIAERIRDKMAASRRRGKWVGGAPPLGYDIDYNAKKLVVNEAEAKTVRWIFQRYLTLRNGTQVAQELRARGVTSKAWVSKTGKTHKGIPFHRGTLYKILGQRTYIGEVSYQGKSYPGEHEGILPRETWDAVQELLAENSFSRGNRNRGTVPGFLKGIARCAHCGSALTMSYTRKKGESSMYRYYRCVTGAKQGAEACPMTQVAAGDLEREVLTRLRKILLNPSVLAATSVAAVAGAPDEGLNLDHNSVLEAMRDLDSLWDQLFPAEQERVVELISDRLDVGLDHCDLHLRTGSIGSLASAVRGMPGASIGDGQAILRLPIRARRRCGRTTVVAAPSERESVHETPTQEADPLVTACARAFRWQDDLESGRVRSVSALAEREQVDEAYVRRQLRLTLVDPAIIIDLVAGGGDVVSIKRAIAESGSIDLWERLRA